MLRLDFLVNTTTEFKHLILSFQYTVKHTSSMEEPGSED